MEARTTRTAPWSESFATIRDWFLFAREALSNPREIGAVLPSSPALARRMARLVDPASPGLVVDLGAGTGVVTEALLARGVPPERLVAVELAPALARLLEERFPSTQVVCGDAANLRRLLRRAVADAPSGPTRIVSSLPFRTLPASKASAILREIASVIRPSGTWIQYTYALAHRRVPTGFRRQRSFIVWGNVPPARVDVFGC